MTTFQEPKDIIKLTNKQQNLVLAVADDELRKNKLSPELYRVYLHRENHIIYVTYVEKRIMEEVSGAKRINPRIEVEVDIENMQVVRSYFVHMSMEQLANFEDFTEKQKTMAITAAAGELRRLKLDPANYRVTVQKEGNVLIVIYVDKDVPEGSRGAKADNPALEVEVNIEDMQVIRSYFVR